MKNLILAAIFLVIATQVSRAGVDQAAQQSLISAEQQADLFSPDAAPFLMEVEFEARVQVPTQGHLTYRWAAKDRWWRKVSLGTFEQIDIRSGEKLYTSRNGSVTPLRVVELLKLVSISEDPVCLTVQKQKEKSEQGVSVSCLQVRNEGVMKKRQLCLNSSREILSDQWNERPDENGRVDYSDYVEFKGHHYPRKIERAENGIKIITVQVMSLATAPLDDALLVPAKGAIERRQCADMKHPVAVKTPDPLYPNSARENRLMGDTTVSMTVFADGSVGEIQLIGSSTRSMDDATLQILKGWKFKPAMCGADPVVSDIQVVVSFRLE